MTLKKDVEATAAGFRALAKQYLAINDDAVKIWSEATDNGIDCHSLPSLKKYVKTSYDFWISTASLGNRDLGDWDDLDDYEAKGEAKRLNAKLIEAQTHFEGRRAEFEILSRRSNAELQIAIDGATHQGNPDD
ncbi:hypothetical protein [Pelagerythrobacter sp.]|uniref:hypothetical protein n=1 Tax=Pelagerythrobacter sp. TaxID=2800702 RepID=UPI0035AE85E5